MRQKVDIKEGYSLNYLIHAFFIIVIGILLFLVHFLPAIVVITLGVMLLLIKTGVIIDLDYKKATAYSSILAYKFGTKSINLKEFNHVRLKYKNEATVMQSRGPSNVIRTKTYTILVFTESNQDALLHEFTNYALALKIFNTLTVKLDYSGYDEVTETQESIKRKRTN